MMYETKIRDNHDLRKRLMQTRCEFDERDILDTEWRHCMRSHDVLVADTLNTCSEITFRMRHRPSRGAKFILVTAVCVSVCMSLAAYYTDPDVTWENRRMVWVPSSHALLGGFAIGARV